MNLLESIRPAICVKYKGPTCRGARLYTTAMGCRRRVIDYPHDRGPGEDAFRAGAEALMAREGWAGDLIGAQMPDYSWVFVVVQGPPDRGRTWNPCADLTLLNGVRV